MIHYWPGGTYPHIQFLSSWEGNLDPDRVGKMLEYLRSEYAPSGGIFEEHEKSDLLIVRNDLLDQLRRDAKRIREPLSYIKALLKVLIVETERSMKGEAHAGAGEHRSESKTTATKENRVADFRARGAWVWTQITEGLPANSVKDELLELTHQYGTPQFLTGIQLDGIMYFLKRRDQVLEGAAEVHDRWWAYELYAQAALRGDRAPLLDEAAGRDAQHKIENLHGNAEHEQNWPFIVEQWEAKWKTGEYHSEEQVKQAVMAEYTEEFGKEISRSTVRRIYKKYSS